LAKNSSENIEQSNIRKFFVNPASAVITGNLLSIASSSISGSLSLTGHSQESGILSLVVSNLANSLSLFGKLGLDKKKKLEDTFESDKKFFSRKSVWDNFIQNLNNLKSEHKELKK